MSDEAQHWTTRPISEVVGDPRVPDGAPVLILLEISNFNDVRRHLGVARADLLMLDVAERVAATMPDARVVTAGRNLVELSLFVPKGHDVDDVTRALRAGFDEPVSIDGEAYRLIPCLGVATMAASDAHNVQLAERAEAALVVARADRSALPPPEHDEAAMGRDLLAALSRDELFLQYQPKLHLRRQEIASVEALIRWQHPQRGLVLPGDFIPAAERTGAIGALTRWTIRQAIADQRVLRRNGQDLPVFINIAGALLSDPAFVADAIAAIGESGARLGFEVTETSVIDDPELAIRHLNDLAAIGVAIAIDDYGAGLSSLAYLKQLPASELKIDKLFVTQLSSSHRDPLIVRSTIDLAHAMEMEVVAEGVETPSALALLAVMGCDMAQGFFVSRPLTLDALLAWLRDDSHRDLVERARAPIEQRLAAVRARA